MNEEEQDLHRKARGLNLQLIPSPPGLELAPYTLADKAGNPIGGKIAYTAQELRFVLDALDSVSPLENFKRTF